MGKALENLLEAPTTAVSDRKLSPIDEFVLSEHIGPVAEQAIAIGARTVWLQAGAKNDSGFAATAKAGLPLPRTGALWSSTGKFDVSRTGIVDRPVHFLRSTLR
ncbi:MAG TPA: CoA-binding protein [Dehalococcoidia bacterium]|nr:CoA-binding protein [Dehalococcoidia bacterium]